MAKALKYFSVLLSAVSGQRSVIVILGRIFCVHNNIGKGKKIKPPIVFQGGVSKNIGVIKAFEDAVNEKIIVDDNSHLMGALGVAILAKESKIEREFNFDIEDINFETRGINCGRCANNCEIICVYKDKNIIDAWGNRCERGEVRVIG